MHYKITPTYSTMELRMLKLEKRIAELDIHEEHIKNIVLDSVHKHLEEWLHDTLTISCITEEIERRYKRTKSDMAEYNKVHRKFEASILEVKEEIKTNFSDICKLKNFIDDLIIDLKLKAYHGDVQRLERILEEKCSWDYAINITKQLGTFAKTDDISEVQTDLNSFKEKIVAEYFLKEEAKKLLKQTENKLRGLLDDHTTKEETRMVINNMHRKFEDTQKEIEEIRNLEVRNEEERKKEFTKIRADFSDNVKNYQYERLRREVETKATKVELEKFMGENMPKITEFTIEFRKIKKCMDEQEKALLRLDEIILNKASKVDLILMKESFSDLPLAKQQERIKVLSISVQRLQSQTECLENDFNEISSILDASSQKISLENEVVMMKQHLLDIEDKLTYKADISETLQNFEKKASWEDFSQLVESIETVHMQTKLLASQISLMLPTKKSIRASSHTKLTRKLVDIVLNSKPTIEDFPSTRLKTFINLPLTDLPKSRSHTPKKKFFNTLNGQ